MDSILTSVKKVLGIEEGYTHFDADIILHINSVFMILNQLGVGPSQTFMIESDSETWTDFLGARTDLVGVKTYMYLKVRMLFDPPTLSAVIGAMESQISEYEWRMTVKAEEGVIIGA